MTTRPKMTEQNLIADGRHVAGAARRHFSVIQQVDAQREKKLLTEERLGRFELNIEALAGASGDHLTGLALQVKATVGEVALRAMLYPELRDMRTDVKLAYPKDRSIGRAYGVGLPLSPLSTATLLKVGGVAIASWQKPELRLAAESAGIDEARIARITQYMQALAVADTAQSAALAQGRGRTLTKAQLIRAVRSETAYVRAVAARVFRDDPAVLTEFASTLPRRAVKPRPDTGGATEGGEKPVAPSESLPQVEKAHTPESSAQS
jgi:hypothetical protein